MYNLTILLFLLIYFFFGFLCLFVELDGSILLESTNHILSLDVVDLAAGIIEKILLALVGPLPN